MVQEHNTSRDFTMEFEEYGMWHRDCIISGTCQTLRKYISHLIGHGVYDIAKIRKACVDGLRFFEMVISCLNVL